MDQVVQALVREQFYIAKGLIAVVAVVLLIVHMQMSWPLIKKWGQRLRYLTLAAFAMNVAYASTDQTFDNLEVRGPYISAMFCILLLVATMIVSIWEDRYDVKARRDRRSAYVGQSSD